MMFWRACLSLEEVSMRSTQGPSWSGGMHPMHGKMMMMLSEELLQPPAFSPLVPQTALLPSVTLAALLLLIRLAMLLPPVSLPWLLLGCASVVIPPVPTTRLLPPIPAPVLLAPDSLQALFHPVPRRYSSFELCRFAGLFHALASYSCRPPCPRREGVWEEGCG